MPKFVVKRKAEVYKEFPIRPFQSRIAIGSEGDNDLIIADKKVSMHHLIIEKEGTRYFVQDSQSAFGSFLNGEKISDRLPLSSGDEIKIGDHSLIFENVLFEKSALDDDQSEAIEITEEADAVTNQLLSISESETESEAVDLDETQVEEKTAQSPAITQKISAENLKIPKARNNF